VGDGLRLALTTFTVLPLRPNARLDRSAGAAALCWAPAVGVALGAAVAGVVLLGRAAGLPVLVGAALGVTALALLTRGLHLDGLADTLDGLGSYGDAERTLAVMRAPDVGAFGVAGLVLALLLQTAALSGLTGGPASSVVAATAVAVGTGRLAATWACRRGVPAARAEGLGALVAGTVRPAAALALTLGLLALAGAAVPSRPWQGPLAVVLGLLAAVVLTRQAVRRAGGVTGDVLGAAVEVATTVALVVLAAGPR